MGFAARAALAGALVIGSGAAEARTEARSAISAYAQARAAASAGAMDRASADFAAALAAAPGNRVVAAEALSHGVTAGDWPLALNAARLLEQSEALLPDARFLLLAESFKTRDWREAARQIDVVEREQLFAFAVPVLRAWRAVGARDADPLSFIEESKLTGPASAYAAEHRPLIQVALGRPEGAAEMVRNAERAGPRAVRLRIAAAAALAEQGERDAALALLQGDDGALAAARALVEARRPIPGAIATPAAGVAELLVKLSLDLHAQDLTPIAASFARLSTWLAPESSETWMVAAELAAQEDRHDAAVAMLANVPAGDPYADAVRDQRIRLLVDGGRTDAALADAQSAAGASGARAADLVRLGEVLSSLDRPREAAEAFTRAIELRGQGGGTYPEWALWLLKGGAHDEADDWPAARSALQEAYRLGPTEPLVLNYLGYAQLSRRENMAEAERLIREAHRLAPDNAAITDSLGWALFLKGERAEGIALLEQAVQGAPADVEINEHLGDAYYAVGRRADARFAWTAARVYAEGEDATRIEAKLQSGMAPELAAR